MACDDASSESLRQRLREGDQQALAELLSVHRDRLWRLIHFRLDRRLHGRVDADDVLQEAYLDALQRLPHYADEPQMSVFVWLRCIVGQTLIDIHRKHLGAQRRNAEREISINAQALSNSTSVSLAAQLLGQITSPSQAAMRVELGSQLEEALEQMNPIDREVLALRHFEELTNTEVAEVLGIQQKAASIRYVRAIKRLKEILTQIPGMKDALETQ